MLGGAVLMAPPTQSVSCSSEHLSDDGSSSDGYRRPSDVLTLALAPVVLAAEQWSRGHISREEGEGQ